MLKRLGLELTEYLAQQELPGPVDASSNDRGRRLRPEITLHGCSRRRPVRNIAVVTAPTPKSLILDLLSTLKGGSMPVGALVEASALFGLEAPGTGAQSTRERG